MNRKTEYRGIVAVVAVALIVSGIIRTVAVGSEELGSPDWQAPWIANPPEVRISSMGQSYNTRRDFREAMVRFRNMEPKQAPSFGIAGADVTWFYGPVEKTAKNKPSAGLATGNYDVFILTPNLRQWGGGKGGTEPVSEEGRKQSEESRKEQLPKKLEATKFYTDIVRKANPKALILINTLWPVAMGKGEARRFWIDANRRMVEQVIASADADVPAGSTPIRICPRGEAIETVYELIESGQVPGIDNGLRLYGDGGHAGDLANYVNALLESAMILQCPTFAFPQRLSYTYNTYDFKKEERTVDLTPEQGEIFHKAAWEALLATPGTDFERPADDSPPSAVTELKQVEATSGRVRLSWSPAQDPETDIFCYEVARSDGARFRTILPQLVDATVKENTEYTYTVTPRNFAGKTGPAVELTLRTPADTTPPTVVRVLAAGQQQVQLFFSEPVIEADALDPSRYRLGDGLAIGDVALGDPLGSVVLLTTDALMPGKTYKLEVGGLRDRSAVGNAMKPAAFELRYQRPEWETVDNSDWDGTVVDLKGDNLLITAQGGYPRSAIFGHPRIVGVYRRLAGDFSFTVALTSQEKTERCLTGILFAPSRAVIEEHKAGLFGIAPDYAMKMDVPPSLEKGLVKARSIVSKGQRGKFIDFPCWLRLVRTGDTFSTFYRLKGTQPDEWTLFGRFTADNDPPDEMLIGVFHFGSSREEPVPNTAMFDLSGRPDAENFTEGPARND